MYTKNVSPFVKMQITQRVHIRNKKCVPAIVIFAIRLSHDSKQYYFVNRNNRLPSDTI